MPVHMLDHVDDEDEGDEVSPRDYMQLYITAWCNCAGPQPSRNNHRADEHDAECPYRKEVEGDVERLS